MIAVCIDCGQLFETTEEEAYSPWPSCTRCSGPVNGRSDVISHDERGALRRLGMFGDESPPPSDDN